MEQTITITFHIRKEDKAKLEQLAKDMKLSLSSYCRYNLLLNKSGKTSSQKSVSPEFITEQNE